MKKYQMFLSYYSLIIATLLFGWAFAYSPKPEGFLLAVLISPIGLYFWLKMSPMGKKKVIVDEDGIKKKVIAKSKSKINPLIPIVALVTLFISSFSIFSYAMFSNKHIIANSNKVSKEIGALKKDIEKIPTSDTNDLEAYDEVLDELDKINKQLVQLRAGSNDPEASLLSLSEPVESDDASVAGQLTAKFGLLTIKDPQNTAVKVYKSKSISSEVIGEARFGKTYLYAQKKGDWYYMTLIADEEGWIQAQFVKEVVSIQ